MAVTSSRHVNAGFFRVHLWVLLGLNTLGVLAVFAHREVFGASDPGWRVLAGVTIGGSVLSYLGSVIWLYEARRPGKTVLIALAALSGVGAILLWAGKTQSTGRWAFAVADTLTSSLLLGATMTAMLLGHWYLNHPGMDLRPLRKLIAIQGVAIATRGVCAAAGLTLVATSDASLSQTFWIFISLRWLAGIVGTAVMSVMAWQTLKVPNTQSATGILYASLILAFIGELVAQLLSVNLAYPV